MKEAAGAITGDEEKKAEGRAQQRKGVADAEAAQRAKTRQVEKEAKEAERERSESLWAGTPESTCCGVDKDAQAGRSGAAVRPTPSHRRLARALARPTTAR